MRICLFGASSDKVDKSFKDAVEKLGIELARRGHTLVYGSGGTGMMGAAARGAHSQNGEIIGVVPKFFLNELVEVLFDKNSETIYTDTMNERKQIMENLADAYLIVPGGIGTFDEFFEILTNKQLGLENKPIAIFNIFNFFDDIDQLINRAIEKNFVSEKCRYFYKMTDNIDEIFDYIENEKAEKFNLKEVKYT